VSTLKERLSETIKTAMKSGDKSTLTYARNLHAAIRKKEIDDRVDLDDAAVQKTVLTMVKQRQDSIEQFKAGNRNDLVEKEEQELKFLMTYLPQQMGEAEVRQIVADAIKEAGATTAKDMGNVMKVLMPKTQGKADGKLVSQIVKELLAGSN
jgi:uncharacterized protein YqeY